MKRLLAHLVLLTGLALGQPPSPAPSIGVATMKPDGTIVLQLRAETRGAIGDGLVEYKKGDPHYQEVLDHLGGLKPGESKPVPPWEEEKPSRP